MFIETEVFVHGCYPIQCSKCGGTLTPPILQKDKKRMVKGCKKCRDVVDITEAWLEASPGPFGYNVPKDTSHVHKNCGGKMVCTLDPNTFKTTYFCFKCGAEIQGIEEMADGKLLESR
jgi:collagenase-like PrtC family protease